MVTAAVVVALLGACSGAAEPEAEPTAPAATPPPAAPVTVEPPEPEELVLPEVDPELLATLPVPDLTELLPPGLPQVGVDGPSALAAVARFPGQVAVPLDLLTAGFAAPGPNAVPVLALHGHTAGFEALPARWLVVDQQPGWVQVMVPVGRGALPSDDPEAVNHHAAWVLASDVELESEPTRLTISLSERTLTITTGQDAPGEAPGSPTPSPPASPTPSASQEASPSPTPEEAEVTFHVGVGRLDRSPTPEGLCVIAGAIFIQTGEPGLLTSCQSEALDGFLAEFALFALHPGGGFDLETGGAVSNGCIRVQRRHFDRYLADIPAGTAVVVLP